MPQAGLVKQEIRGFLGVNLRTERLDLADEELAKAINADLHTQPGSIVLRLGRTKQFSSALSDTVIRRLAKINSKRYQVAGTAVYRDQVSILTGLSGNLFTTIIPFRPLNETTIWAFIADDALMRKDNGTTVRIWGIAAPSAAVKQALGAAPGLTGNYSVRYTFVRKTSDGKIAHEGNPSAVPIVIAATAQHITVSGFEDTTDPQITHARFYRTLSGGSLYLFESEIPFGPNAFGYAFTWEADEIVGANEFKFTTASSDGNIQVCFAWEKDHVDNAGVIGTNSVPVASTSAMAWLVAIADSALGTAVETDNDRPPNASWATEFQEHVVLTRDSTNPHYVWISKRFRPESFPAANFMEIGNPDDPVQCAVPMAGLLGAFTRRTKYRVLGNIISGFVAQEALSRRGTPAPLAVVPTEHGTIFVARDGIFVTNYISSDEQIADSLLPLFFGETINGMSPINWNQASTMAATTYKNRYYLAYPSGSSSNPDKIAVFSNTTKKWYYYDHPMRSLFIEEDVDDIVGGSTDGFVYILEDGSTDAGANITLDVETKDYSGNEPSVRKLFRYLRIDADADSDTLPVRFYTDGTLKHSVNVTGSRTKLLLPLPEKTFGYTWRVGFPYSGSKRPRIHGIAALWLPLEAA